MIPADITQRAPADWIRIICERKHPMVSFQPLVNSPGDLVEFDSGWCDIGWASYWQ